MTAAPLIDDEFGRFMMFDPIYPGEKRCNFGLPRVLVGHFVVLLAPD